MQFRCKRPSFWDLAWNRHLAMSELTASATAMARSPKFFNFVNAANSHSRSQQPYPQPTAIAVAKVTWFRYFLTFSYFVYFSLSSVQVGRVIGTEVGLKIKTSSLILTKMSRLQQTIETSPQKFLRCWGVAWPGGRHEMAVQLSKLQITFDTFATQFCKKEILKNRAQFHRAA